MAVMRICDRCDNPGAQQCNSGVLILDGVQFQEDGPEYAGSVFVVASQTGRDVDLCNTCLANLLQAAADELVATERAARATD